MEKISQAPEDPGALVSGVTSHLEHPLRGRMSGQAGESDPTRFQMDEEQDVVVARPRQVSTSTVKKSVPARTAKWEAMKSLQVVVWLRFGAGGIPYWRRMLPAV